MIDYNQILILENRKEVIVFLLAYTYYVLGHVRVAVYGKKLWMKYEYQFDREWKRSYEHIYDELYERIINNDNMHQ